MQLCLYSFEHKEFQERLIGDIALVGQCLTDETVKACAYNFPKSGISTGNQVNIEHTLRTI